MDTDIIIDDEDLVYQLTKEYQSSLLDDADASPSEILADVASFLAAPISPVLSSQSSPNESSYSDSGSEDDFRIKYEKSLSPEQQSSQSPFENEPKNILKPEDVDSFIQRTAPVFTNTNVPANEPIPNTSLPQRTGPVMSIENGVIKGIKLGFKNSNEDELKTNQYLLQNSSSTENLHKSYFNVVNENLQPSNLKSKDGNVHLVLEQKKVPSILKRTNNILFNEPQKLVIPAESTNRTKIAIVPISKTYNDQETRSYQVQMSPPHSIILSPKIESPEHSVISPHSNVTLSLENILGPLMNGSEFTDAEKRAIKKQQRMIKNRETACRSRQKKKEHLATLEQRLVEAEKEITRLQQENKMLREQLQNGGRIRKIPRLNSSSIVPKKNIALIFAMVFMVSLNWNFIGWNSKPFVGPTNSYHGSRHLLWTEDTNDVSPGNPGHDKFRNSSSDSADCKNAKLSASAYMHINQTESIRIAGELNRWIGSGKTLNWTNSSKKKQPALQDNNEEKNSGGFPETYNLFSKLNYDSFEIPTLTQNQGKNVKEKSRLRKLRRSISVEKDVDFPDANIYYESLYRKPIRKPLNDFDMDDLSEWNDLLRALHRRDDTFYVVGVGKGEHLLLPAVSHNITRPPKMALILPARSGNDSQMNDHVTLMQIDCSVVNTTLVKLKSEALPESLRKSGQDIKVKNYSNHKSDNNINNKDTVEPDLSRITRRMKINESNAIFPQRRQHKPSNIDLNKKDLFSPYIISKIEDSKKLVHEN